MLLQCPQVEIATEHLLHGGMYTRTIRLKPGTVLMGSLIELPTVFIVNGQVSLLVGDERVDLEGYNVIPGCAGRKQLVVAGGNVEITMIFPTFARTIEDAEDEIFAEAEFLMSRLDPSMNTVTITGE
jgi:hypothetical protein